MERVAQTAMRNQQQSQDAIVLISVIVPVYNKQATLAKCVESLSRQTMPKDAFEVILIDDGSTDNSLKICNDLAKRYRFVRVIHQKNQGVSGARNTGIKAARGAYLMFLDADDAVNDCAIERVFLAFEQFGEATDVVATRMVYCKPNSDKQTYHKREEWLERTGLYDLSAFPYAAQSTMNVCVRNRFKDNILFDPTMKMGEDTLYITQNLERKGTLGYCAEAEYYYVRESGSASARFNNPLYAYDDMMKLYGTLVEMGKGNLGAYARQLVLYNIDWRIRANMLFPTYCQGEERRHQEQRLADIMKEIPPADIAASPYLREYHKAMLLDRYGKIPTDANPEYAEGAAEIKLVDNTIWKTDTPLFFVERCTLHEGTLHIRGRLVCPVFMFDERPQLSFEIGGKPLPIELGSSSFDYVAARVKVGKAWSFACTIALADICKERSTGSIAINLICRGKSVPTVEVELDPTVHNARLLANNMYFKEATLKPARNAIKVHCSNPAIPAAQPAFYDIVHPKNLARRVALQSFARTQGSARIWLYVDLPTSPMEGNALVQLLADLDRGDGVVRYYVSDHASLLEQRYPQLKEHIVASRTRRHAYLAMRAELVLASYLERFTYMPLKRRRFDQLGDLLVRPQKRVYLQHGVVHAHMPWYFSYDRIMFDYEVISTDYERRVLTDVYHFPEDAIIASGAPRLDRIKTGNAREAVSHKIAFIPSWRNYLVAGTADKREAVDSVLTSSSFYQGVARFMELLVQSDLLEEYDCVFDMKLHPNFHCYRHLFKFESERIRLLEDSIEESDYELVITDYSSYVYDFVYAGADVMYFLPDAKEFHAGLNHYSKLEWPLEEGFGPYCETAEDALSALQAHLQRGKSTSSDNTASTKSLEQATYDARRESLFLFKDGHNTERLYDLLWKITCNNVSSEV